MKKELNLMLLILLLSTLFFDVRAMQNFIYNYDFEFYNLCPDNVGQSNRCVGFFNLIEDVDYSNCNYDITHYYPDSGQYNTNCGGFYLYGFEDNVMGPNWTLCEAYQFGKELSKSFG